jgi:hypothetical protein
MKYDKIMIILNIKNKRSWVNVYRYGGKFEYKTESHARSDNII